MKPMTFNWLKTDSYTTGAILAFAVPVVFTALFLPALSYLQHNVAMLAHIKPINAVLLGLACNLLVMRYYLVRLQFAKTAKTILLLTVIMIIAHLILVRNINFAV